MLKHRAGFASLKVIQLLSRREKKPGHQEPGWPTQCVINSILKAQRRSHELPEGSEPFPLNHGGGLPSCMVLVAQLAAAVCVYSSFKNAASKIHCVLLHWRELTLKLHS